MRNSILLKKYISEIIETLQQKQNHLSNSPLHEFIRESLYNQNLLKEIELGDRRVARLEAKNKLIITSDELINSFTKSINRHVQQSVTESGRLIVNVNQTDLEPLRDGKNAVILVSLSSEQEVLLNFDPQSMTATVHVEFNLSEIIPDREDLAIALQFCSSSLVSELDSTLKLVGFSQSSRDLSESQIDECSYTFAIPFKMKAGLPLLDTRSKEFQELNLASSKIARIPQAKIATFQKALRDYEEYDISVTKKFYGTGHRSKEWSAEEKKKKIEKGYSNVNLGYPLEGNVGRWIKWPENMAKLSGSEYSDKSSVGDEDVDTGKGEKWIAALFGGKWMGSSSVYDISINGKKFECKELTTKTNLVRPGKYGIIAIKDFKDNIDEVARNVKMFSDYLIKSSFSSEKNEKTKVVLQKISQFIDESYQNIVEAGEISKSRFTYLLSIVENIKDMLSDEGMYAGKDPSESPEIVLKGAGKDAKDFSVKVPKLKYLKILDVLEKSISSEDLSKAREHIFSNAARYLTSDVFDPDVNPEEWFKNLFKQVDVEKVFPSDLISGVFIVNPVGFYLIPSSDLKSKLKFEVVSQGRPRFSFSDLKQMNDAGEINSGMKD